MDLIRIQKYLSDMGICSRRHAEIEIESGTVFVNHSPAVLGQKINPEKDYVEYKGKHVKNNFNTHHTYVMLNKPSGYITTMSDDRGRKTIVELIRGVKNRVYPVGRLDMYSEGLLLSPSDS